MYVLGGGSQGAVILKGQNLEANENGIAHYRWPPQPRLSSSPSKASKFSFDELLPPQLQEIFNIWY